MKKLFIIVLTLVFVPTLSYSEQKPYKFFKNEILFGLAKKQLRNDTRSISSKKALSIYEGSDGKTVLLSEVSPYKRTSEQLTEFFQDNSYMGEFTKFIKKVELPGYQDKMRSF